MGFCGDREKALDPSAEQKWDYINLGDFKSSSCLTPFSYMWLWILVIISVAVYAADAFTAVNLLAYNKWTSQVKPVIPFDVAKWIFAVCIILSYAFLAYRWFRAWRVIRSGSVTESYLEPLAAIFNSLRLPSQGWRRFLVYAALTKSRKGVDYLALFVYFQFKGALLVVLAQGPRMVINALTLWAVMQAQILPVGDHAAPKDQSPILQFFANIKTMIDKGDKRETIIYFTMLFSFAIWVIAALSLIISVVLYLLFLWHYVPNADGTLTRFCRRKMEDRLDRIVNKRARKTAEEKEAKRKRDAERALRGGKVRKQGFLDDETDSIRSVQTTTTLPPYPARSNTTSTLAPTPTTRTNEAQSTWGGRPIPSRTDTGFSTTSNDPLLKEAGAMSRVTPPPPVPQLDQHQDYFRDGPTARPPPGMAGRSYTDPTQQRGPLPPLNTHTNSHTIGRDSPSTTLISPLPSDFSLPQDNPYPMHNPQTANPTFSPYDDRAPTTGPTYQLSPVSPIDSSPLADMLPHYDPRYSQRYSQGSNDDGAPAVPNSLLAGAVPQLHATNNNTTHTPSRVGTAPPGNPRAGLPATLQTAIQRREVGAQQRPYRAFSPMAQQQRSATAPIPNPGWGQGLTPRSNTAAPDAGAYRRDMSQPLPHRGGDGLMHSGGWQDDYSGYPEYTEYAEPQQYPRSATAGPAPYRHEVPPPMPRMQPNHSNTAPPDDFAWNYGRQQQGPYPRSNTAGPRSGGYNDLDFSMQ